MSQLIGKRIVVYEMYDDGREVQHRNTVRKIRRPVKSLKDIWEKGSPLTYEIFMDRIQNGNAIVNGSVWTGGSLSILVTYDFLANDAGSVKKHHRTETIYNAFKGSFSIPKVNGVRALRDRQRDAIQEKNYRKRQEKFRHFLHNLFYDFCAENMRGTDQGRNLRNI